MAHAEAVAEDRTNPETCGSTDKPQRILVFQQQDSGENKIRGIRQHGGDCFDLRVYDIDEPLPSVLDDSSEYLPVEIDADLVLDYLRHPDLSQDLAELCRREGVPLVASGKKLHGRGVYSPPVCCALPEREGVGQYAACFGMPRFRVRLEGDRIRKVEVMRGAPCGATHEAVEGLKGLTAEEAPARLGLKTQFFCTADPSGWDPLWGKSPVHLAAELHEAALKRAIERARES
jgi:hypothetical protein